MKRIKHSISIEIPPVRLFLEDIKAIEEIYKEHFKTYSIKTDDFELDSSEELEKIGKDKLSRLSFESSEPYIHVDLSRHTATIYSSSDDVNSAGIVSKLKDILDKRITPLRYLAKPWLLVPLTILFWSYLGLLIRKENKVASAIGALSAVGIMIGWLLWSFMFENKHSVIYLKSKSSQRNFFSRNKDQVLLSIFSAIVTVLIYTLVLWVIGRFK